MYSYLIVVHERRVNSWAVDIEPLGFIHNQLMGWGNAMSSEDPFESFRKMPMNTFNAEEAVKHAEEKGWGYSIVYPRGRHFEKKWYEDNFKWDGEPVDPEDEENY